MKRIVILLIVIATAVVANAQYSNQFGTPSKPNPNEKFFSYVVASVGTADLVQKAGWSMFNNKTGTGLQSSLYALSLGGGTEFLFKGHKSGIRVGGEASYGRAFFGEKHNELVQAKLYTAFCTGGKKIRIGAGPSFLATLNSVSTQIALKSSNGEFVGAKVSPKTIGGTGFINFGWFTITGDAYLHRIFIAKVGYAF